MASRRRSGRQREAIRHIGVVVPAHDEADLIEACLRSIDRAAAYVRAFGIEVTITVVCDACTDGTPDRVKKRGFEPVRVDFRNVGAARAHGAALALAAGVDWLAFTDADTEVAPSWLLDQVALDSDAFCGTIGVVDWGPYDIRMHEHFCATYTDAEDHRHIHGANFGISAVAYRATGGFEALTTGEDVAIVAALVASDFEIAWSAVPRVTTSARCEYRAPGGFGATLERVAAAFKDTPAQGGELATSLPAAASVQPA